LSRDLVLPTASFDKKETFKYAVNDQTRVEAELGRRNLFDFIKLFWGVVSSDTPVWNWHIPYLCDELSKVAHRVSRFEKKEYDLIINIPPGTTKSLTCSVMFPVWCWINWPWMKFICASYTGDLALEQAIKSRRILKSDKFERYYPEVSITKDKDSKSNFGIQNNVFDIDGNFERHIVGGDRYTTSVGGTLTGFHGHILIVDDPLDPNRAVSDSEIHQANRWIDETLSTRKADKAVTTTILIMQRLHQNDPTGYLTGKKGKKFYHICLPGEIKDYEEFVKPKELIKRYKNKLLDPKRMDWDIIQDLKIDLGTYGYAGQIGQNPVPPGGGMFKVDHFQVIDSIKENDIQKTVRYWDKAGSDNTGDYTVGTKVHQLKNGKYLIADVKRGQWSAHKRELIIRQTAEADGASVVVYFEQEPGSAGKDGADATVRNLIGFAVYPDRASGDKINRADPYSAQVNMGNVFLLRGMWNYEFIEEHKYFPFSAYKDQVDSASGAFSKLAKKRKVRTLLKRRD
jgi:predicted phage terminase large subunit-like protein